MENLTMVLVNSKEIPLTQFILPMSATVECKDEEELIDLLRELTQANMTSVSIKDGEKTVLEFDNVTLTGFQCMLNKENRTVYLYLDGAQREILSADLETTEYAQAAKILLGEEN